MRISVEANVQGGHVHMKVFVNGGKAGDLCVTIEEWPEFMRRLNADHYSYDEPSWINEES